MLDKIKGNIGSYLECGCNIGRNIEQLNRIIPDSKKSIIEISEPAYNFVTKKYNFTHKFHGAILDSRFEPQSFDLVFTIGVLIHINPELLLAHMEKIYNYSSKYILIGEYFNRTPISIEYQGKDDKLFKRDFGKLFIENFDCKLIDYGFLWGHIYDTSGFDDITWWIFKKV
jgi:pseudaminic acid biosynthesis-associated methylase